MSSAQSVDSQVRCRLRYLKILTKIFSAIGFSKGEKLKCCLNANNWSPFQENCTKYVRTSSSGKMSHMMQISDKQKWILVSQKSLQKDPLHKRLRNTQDYTLCLKRSITLTS